MGITIEKEIVTGGDSPGRKHYEAILFSHANKLMGQFSPEAVVETEDRLLLNEQYQYISSFQRAHNKILDCLTNWVDYPGEIQEGFIEENLEVMQDWNSSDRNVLIYTDDVGNTQLECEFSTKQTLYKNRQARFVDLAWGRVITTPTHTYYSYKSGNEPAVDSIYPLGSPQPIITVAPQKNLFGQDYMEGVVRRTLYGEVSGHEENRLNTSRNDEIIDRKIHYDQKLLPDGISLTASRFGSFDEVITLEDEKNVLQLLYPSDNFLSDILNITFDKDESFNSMASRLNEAYPLAVVVPFVKSSKYISHCFYYNSRQLRPVILNAATGYNSGDIKKYVPYKHALKMKLNKSVHENSPAGELQVVIGEDNRVRVVRFD